MGGGGNRSRLEIRDLVLIALLAAVGGVLSTYIGYLGNLVNRLFGVPFGAGQLIAGLHIVWPLLARALVGRFGSGTLTGLVKGVVEFLSGGTHGVVIVLVSVVEGLIVDVGMGMSRRRSLPIMMLSGAAASVSNVFVFQAIYFSGVSLAFIFVMAGLSFLSGAFFGGYVTWDLQRLLTASRLIRTSPQTRRTAVPWRRHLLTLVVVGVTLAGGVYYYVAVFDPFAAPDAARIEGAVAAPYMFRYDEWDGDRVSITAELRGSVTYVPPREYVGVPLREILSLADPQEGAGRVRVIADDGYEVSFELPAVLADPRILLTLGEGRLRLVAADYEGSLWVERVVRFVIE